MLIPVGEFPSAHYNIYTRLEPVDGVPYVVYRRLQRSLMAAMTSMIPSEDVIPYGDEEVDRDEDEEEKEPIQYANVPDNVFKGLVNLKYMEYRKFWKNLNENYEWTPDVVNEAIGDPEVNNSKRFKPLHSHLMPLLSFL